MKLTKTLLGAMVAGMMALAASQSQAGILLNVFPLVRLNFSGAITYGDNNTTTNGTVIRGTALKKVGFNTQKLIDLLNASPTFKSALTNQFHSASSNQVPAGSYIVWNIDSYSLIITNKNGFSFDLYNNLSGDEFGYIGSYYDFLIGDFVQNATTQAGSETDMNGIYFYFYDYNGDEIEAYGTANLKWSYGAASAGTQKTTLSASITGGNYYAEVNGNQGTPQFKAAGSGTGTDPVVQNPFYQWY